MADSSDPTLGELLGTSTDVSFSDPEPLVNHPASFIAITIVFMVSNKIYATDRSRLPLGLPYEAVTTVENSNRPCG